MGWDYEIIEKRLKEWNSKNKEPLRDVYLAGQLRYHKQSGKRILPPNCDNSAYYRDMGIKCSDEICSRCRNPVQYAIRKTWLVNRENAKPKKQKAGAQ